MQRQWQILEMIVHASHKGGGRGTSTTCATDLSGQGRSHAAPDPPFALALYIRHLTRLTLIARSLV